MNRKSPIDKLPRVRPWAAWELRLLAENYGDSLTADIARALGRNTGAVSNKANQLGLKKAPGFIAESTRCATLARSPFTPEISEVIELLYPDTLTQDIADFIGMPLGRVHAYAGKQGWRKTLEFNRETARARAGPDHPMRKFQFKKGQVPPNKGVKGITYPGMEATQFKKGVKSGKAAQHWVPIGSYRVNGDGFLDRKVSDEPNRGPRNWAAVHRLVWIEAKGAIPKGHVVRFKPGRKSTRLEDITVDALECITLAENGSRNIFHNNYPPEVVKLVQTRALMTRLINKRQRAQTEERT